MTTTLQYTNSVTEKLWRRITSERYDQRQCKKEILSMMDGHHCDEDWSIYENEMWHCLVYLYTLCNNSKLKNRMRESIVNWKDNCVPYDELVDFTKTLIEDYILNAGDLMVLKADIEKCRQLVGKYY